MKYRDIDTTPTQTERADARQIQNSAGGFVYGITDDQRLRRFLVLGTEGGTFYASQRDLTKANVDFLKEYAAKDPNAYFGTLLDVDANNVAPRHSTVLLALAVLYTHAGTQQAVVPGLDAVATFDARREIEHHFLTFVRTGTHLFEFVDYVTQWRKWGRGLRRLVGNWYKDLDSETLAYQVVKYRQRGGWSHRDLLRKSHPQVSQANAVVLDYVTHGRPEADGGQVKAFTKVIDQFESVKEGELDPIAADALSWEMLPTEALKDPKVWKALVDGGRVPYTALLRNLGRMTNIGVFEQKGGADTLRNVVTRLSNPEFVQRGRVHPFNVLTALKTYSSGTGFRGSLAWVPNQNIVRALDTAFYAAFKNVPSTGKRTLIGLDVSGSMGCRLMDSNVTARDASVAMAMATIAADPFTTDVIAFTSGGWSAPGARTGWRSGGVQPVAVDPSRRMDDVLRETGRLPFGGTDCSLPMLWAQAQGKEYDAFVIYTDNETWAGAMQPMEALRRYRASHVRDARLAVVGMTATQFSIADPQDVGSMDVVGFDASAPATLANFIAGRF